MFAIRDLVDAVRRDDWFDPQTFHRGRAYATAGRVLEIAVDHEDDYLVLTAVVIGSRSYRVELVADLQPRDIKITATCSCPVGWFCKHAAAALVAADRAEPADRDGEWRRSLEEILTNLDPRDPAGPAAAARTVELALQVLLPNPQRAGRYVTHQLPARPRLALRPVRMGASQRWVKSGVTWNDLGGPGPLVGFGGSARDRLAHYPPAQIELLRELQGVLQVGRNRWSSPADALDLHEAGVGLWAVLERMSTVGLPLVCSDPAITLTVQPDAADLRIDLARAGDQVVIQPGVTVGDDWYAGDDVSFIGDPAHGAVLWGSSADDDQVILLAPFDRRPAPALRQWISRGGPIAVPPANVPELIADYLPRMSNALTVGSRDGTVSMPEPPLIGLHAQLSWLDDASARLRWRWDYVFDPEGAPVRRSFGVDDPSDDGPARHRSTELAIIEQAELSEELAVFVGLGRYGPGTLVTEQLVRGRDAMDFAEQLLPELLDHPEIDLETRGDQPDFREATGTPVVRFASSDDDHREGRTDWLELEIVVSIDDDQLGTVQIGLADVLAALTSGETTVMVGRGVYVDLDRPELDRLAQLVADARELTEQPRGGLRLSRDQHDLLASVQEIGPTDGQVVAWVNAAAALRDLDSLPAPAEPDGLTATLRPYQRDGYQWLTFLHEHGLGGVLADDMGLGKTVQALAMIVRDRESADPTGAPRLPFLVIAPSSVVGTWVSEARTFAPNLSVVAITESRARRGWALSRVDDPAYPVDVVVTTYTLLRLEAEDYAAQRWAGLLLDEAQSVKNHLSKTYAAARAIDAGSRFAITGTPMENNLMELWSVLSLAAPGLFPFAARFKDRFAKPIEQGQDAATLASLRRRIRPVMLRRTKELVAADLPPKQEQVLEVELSPRHRKIYDTHLQRERQRILKLLDDLDENRITILASLTRLRQLSLDPGLVDEEYDSVGSAKIDTLIEHLTEITAEGHRALVFSQFTGFLGRIRARLDAAGIAYSYLDGRTRKRAAVIDGFKDGTDPVFLISLKAGGVGLTLTEADYCFLLDPWWNPAVEAQAVDRTHRIGQTRNVVVYRLVSAGTIEQKVMELAQRKAALFSSVLDADSMMSSALTASDIAGLLGGVDDPMIADE